MSRKSFTTIFRKILKFQLFLSHTKCFKKISSEKKSLSTVSNRSNLRCTRPIVLWNNILETATNFCFQKPILIHSCHWVSKTPSAKVWVWSKESDIFLKLQPWQVSKNAHLLVSIKFRKWRFMCCALLIYSDLSLTIMSHEALFNPCTASLLAPFWKLHCEGWSLDPRKKSNPETR